MRKGHKLTTFMVILTFFITFLFPVYADELEEHQRQLQDVSRQINQNKKVVDQKKQEERSIMGQIKAIEEDISSTEKEINSLSERIAFLTDSIARTEEDIKRSEEELAEKDALLSERLEYIYKQGNVSYMEVLFSATDIKDFLTRYDMLNLIVEQDIELIEEVNKERNELEMKKSDLEVKEKELKAIQAEQRLAKEQLDSQKEDKQSVLSTVASERKAYEQALAELERTSAQIETMIRQIQAASGETVLGTGVFTWPTPGHTSITSPYGMRHHPILQQWRIHTGTDIGAPMSASIVAADSGTVIFVGWMNANGNTTIIDHGGGISTVYAHQSQFLVQKGDAVIKGQEIGKVGSTGWSTGPHLHFEVRVNGVHTDPMAYI